MATAPELTLVHPGFSLAPRRADPAIEDAIRLDTPSVQQEKIG